MVKYIQNYVLYESIGAGVYGKVYRGINNNDKKQYAIKVIPIQKFKENKKLQECTVNEINILTNIESHPNIIKYYDMLKTSNNFYFIYQFCNGGTLENLLTKQKRLTEPNALMIFKQLIQAFSILNKYNIMHRDMKPDNIFFHNGVIKLGDFGFCKNLNSADEMTKTMLGSPIYMAPEVLKGQIYSNKADIWSLGVVLYEMIYGMCPFQSNSIANLIQVLNSKELQFPGPISGNLRALITKMLTKDPIKRISWWQLFQIPINQKGQIQTQKTIHNISSLNDAVNSLDSQGQVFSSNKSISDKTESTINEEPPRDFKKNRNTNNAYDNSPVGPASGQKPTNSGYQNNNNAYLSPVISPNKIQQQVSPTNNNNYANINISITNGTKPPIPQQISQQAKSINGKISDDHKLLIEGVRLSMEIIEKELPNRMGYAHLILSRSIWILNDLLSKSNRKELSQLFQKELKDLEQERQSINTKMFAYELKGLEDWKKYLRGKFFEEESTISYWFKMVTFLNGTYGTYNLNQISPAQIVKQILY